MTPANPSQSSELILAPETYRHLSHGVHTLVDLIRPTLGPLPRQVLAAGGPGGVPELLDSGGLIARRFSSLDREVGAAYLRRTLVELYERSGDGTAAAAVMFGRLFDEGVRYAAAGGNPMLLRRHLEEGLVLLLAGVDGQRQALAGKERLAGFAATALGSASPDPLLAQTLGEIFDVIGEFGRLEIVEGKTADLERDYVDGMYWDKGLVSPHMATQKERAEAHLENPAILLSNFYLHRPDLIVPVLETAVAEGYRSLLFVSTGFSEKVIGLFTTKANQEKLWVAAVEPPGIGDERLEFIQDLAILTGAEPMLRESDLETELVFSSQRKFRGVRPENFGRARRAWATVQSTGISGPKGDPKELRGFLTGLRRQYEAETDGEARRKLRGRLGRLMGGSATLYVGGSHPLAIRQRRERAERAAQALRNVLREGVVPGGGAALLTLLPALEERRQASAGPEERVAYSLLIKMVQEPARVLLENAGRQPEPILEAVRRAGAGYAYDALAGRLVPVLEAGLLDSAAAVKGSLQAAVSGAALALTVGAVVRGKNRP